LPSGAVAKAEGPSNGCGQSDDPVRLIRAIDEQMDSARQHLSYLADERARLAAWLYAEHGPTEGARLLGVNRNSLYRTVQRFLAGQGLEVDPDSRRQLREALTGLLTGVAVGAAVRAMKDSSTGKK
jgi:hypothetical protein